MALKIRFIGDVHGKWHRYRKLIKNVPVSLQVGDFGVGFLNQSEEKYSNPPFHHMAKGDHKFIRGNHDNPSVCANHPFWVPDGAVIHEKIFCVGGAQSTDQHRRIQGLDWWPDEELSYREFLKVMDAYEEAKPEILVAHEMPHSVAEYVCQKLGYSMRPDKSITRQCLDAMIGIHKPKVFIHGHWHFDHQTEVQGVTYIGLGELKHIDMEV